ncbi:MAG: serpin family protein [Planctomycetes bacterium]|nr:serpin family protein [Planctomycetota bacterium]
MGLRAESYRHHRCKAARADAATCEPLEPRLLLSAGLIPAECSPADAPTAVDGGLIVQLGRGAARGVTYSDADGTTVTVGCRPGWVTLGLTGENLQWETTRGVVRVSGEGVQLEQIHLQDTSYRTRLTLRTDGGGDARATLGAVTGAMPLGALVGKQVDLVGEGIALTDTGSIAALWLGDLDADITLAGMNRRGTTVRAAVIHDGADILTGSPVRVLRAEAWLDSDDIPDLQAPALGKVLIHGDCTGDLRLVGRSGPGVTLGGGKIGGDLVDALWAVEGRYRPVRVGGEVSVTPNLPPQGEVKDLIATLADGNTAFAFDLYHALREDGASDNLCLSPYALSLSLAALYGAVDDPVAAQMADTLHFDLPPERLTLAFNAVQRELWQAVHHLYDTKTALTFAGAVQVAQGLPGVGPLDCVLVRAGRELVPLPNFAGSLAEASGTADDWTAWQIRRLVLETLSADNSGPTAVTMAQSLLFKAPWQREFDCVDAAWTFHGLDGRPIALDQQLTLDETWLSYYGRQYEWVEPEIIFVHLGDDPPAEDTPSGWVLADEDPGFQAIRLRYSDAYDMSMLVLLPDEGRFEEIEASLSPALLDTVIAGLKGQEVDVVLPAFATDRPMSDLSTQLGAMGMPGLFSADVPNGVYLNSLQHGAGVAIDESGTQAGAVTVQEMPVPPSTNGSTGCSVEGDGSFRPDPPTRVFTADRPFIYMIRHDPTDTILFMGRWTGEAADPS